MNQPSGSSTSVAGRSCCPRRRLHLGLAIAMAVLVAGFVAATGPWADTRYAPGYSAAAFDRLVIGDDESSVREGLGEPMRLAIGPGGRRYLSYTCPTRTPGHMVRRCVIIDGKTAKVVEIDRRTSWDYGGRLWSAPSSTAGARPGR